MRRPKRSKRTKRTKKTKRTKGTKRTKRTKRTKGTKRTKRTKRTKLIIGGTRDEKIMALEASYSPFWYNKLSFPLVSDNKNLLEDKTWKNHLDLASELYKNKSSLSKGTILFHGSPIINPLANLNLTDKPLFFGLDAFVAIWYLSEWAARDHSNMESLLSALEETKIRHQKEIEDLKNLDITKWTENEISKMKKQYDDKVDDIIKHEDEFIKSIKLLMDKIGIPFKKLENFTELLLDIKLHNRRYYFLNIYETQVDIPYKYLEESIMYINPLDIDDCKKMACMHPQFGYHLHELKPPVELSMEFTIPANQIGNKLKLIGIYVIDIFKLNENKDKTFPEFKATEAIVLKNLYI